MGDESHSEDGEAGFVTSLRSAMALSEDGRKSPNKAPEVGKPRKINKKEGEVLVKVLKLDNYSENKDGIVDDTDNDGEDSSDDKDNSAEDSDGGEKPKLEAPFETKTRKKSSFFLGGESESDNEDNDEEQEPVPFGEDVLQKRRDSLKHKFDIPKDGRGRSGRGDSRGFGRVGRGGDRGSYRG